MGVSPILVTFQTNRHFPLNHDSGRKSRKLEWDQLEWDLLEKFLNFLPSKIEWDLTNGTLAKILELLDTQV